MISRSTLRSKVKQFLERTQPNVRLYLLRKLFEEENNCQISKSWFNQLANEYSETRTVRTGAAEVRNHDICMLHLSRAFHRVSISNVWAIDEKIFHPKRFILKSVRVSRGYHGPIYKTLFSNLKLQPFYLLCAVGYNGIVGWILEEEPIETTRFSGFLVNIARMNKRKDRWLVFDNATFHKATEIVHPELEKHNCSISFTAPCSCFTNPIEEVFALMSFVFLELYHDRILRNGLKNIPRREIRGLIEQAVQRISGRSFLGFFLRSGLVLD